VLKSSVTMRSNGMMTTDPFQRTEDLQRQVKEFRDKHHREMRELFRYKRLGFGSAEGSEGRPRPAKISRPRRSQPGRSEI